MIFTAHFAADGLAELLCERLDAMNGEQFAQWMRFHLYTCQKREFLGYSSHIVYAAHKNG